MAVLCLYSQTFGADVIRVNQMGYFPEGFKTAVFLSERKILLKKFVLVDNLSGKTVFNGVPEAADGSLWGMGSAFRLNFSAVVQPGGYHLEAGDAISPPFPVSSGIYGGTGDFVLKYLRQQRCGFNPFLQDSCHTADGIVTDHPTKSGTWMDVTGGGTMPPIIFNTPLLPPMQSIKCCLPISGILPSSRTTIWQTGFRVQMESLTSSMKPVGDWTGF